MKKFTHILFSFFFLFTFSGTGLLAQDNSAEENAYRACGEIQKPAKKGREVKKGSDLMTVVLLLEGQGKGNLRPEYDAPGEFCLAGELAGEGNAAHILYTPFEKGFQTLHYMVLFEGDGGEREFLVLYNGTASLLRDGYIFYVTETRNGITSFYAMYDNQPNLKTIQKLFQHILDGKRESLIEVHWPEDAPELLISKYDTKRIK